MTLWKSVERKLASIFGGKREPITGRQRGSTPDVSHEWLSIEVKHREKLPQWLYDALDQAEKSRKDGQIPIVILHQKGMRHVNELILMKLGEFVKDEDLPDRLRREGII